MKYNPEKLLILTFHEAKNITRKYFEELIENEKCDECKVSLCKQEIIDERNEVNVKKSIKDYTTAKEKYLGRLFIIGKYGF